MTARPKHTNRTVSDPGGIAARIGKAIGWPLHAAGGVEFGPVR